MRTIGLVTVARSDYGIYRPILDEMQACPDLKPHLFVSGMHLSPEFGLTVQAIEADGFTISERVEMLLSSDSPQGIGKSMGLGVIGFAQAYARFQPDMLLLLGDRFEMLAAAMAAMPYNIPLAHLHGGETSEGSIDEGIRHALTKMSHLHFVSTEPYRRRVIQMGEAPWRVVVSGAPALDHIRTLELLAPAELEQRIGLSLQPPPLLVTYHPVTLEYDDTARQISNLLTALAEIDLPVLFTYPNADTHGRLIMQAIDRFVQTHPQARVVPNLGTQAYFSVLKYAAAMVGNSSSGIIEAASFELPVVNIGHRQRGRIRGMNVIDVGYEPDSIKQAILQAVSADFRDRLVGMTNPYGAGGAAKRIVETLQRVKLDRKLLLKQFYDLPFDEVN